MTRYQPPPAAQGDARPAMAWRPLLVAAAAALLVAGLGGLATDIGPWYRDLRRPSWQPPDWAFGPAWTLIFSLTALAGLRAWHAAPEGVARRRLLLLYALNGALNILWSVLFFTLHRPAWALVEVVFLWLSILALILASARHSRPAGWMLLPYLAWVGFAGVLNWAIVRLNPGA